MPYRECNGLNLRFLCIAHLFGHHSLLRHFAETMALELGVPRRPLLHDNDLHHILIWPRTTDTSWRNNVIQHCNIKTFDRYDMTSYDIFYYQRTRWTNLVQHHSWKPQLNWHLFQNCNHQCTSHKGLLCYQQWPRPRPLRWRPPTRPRGPPTASARSSSMSWLTKTSGIGWVF